MTLLAFIAPATARNLLLIAFGIGYLAYHVLRWWWQRDVVRAGEKVENELKAKVEERDVSPSTSQTPQTPQAPQTLQTSQPSPIPGEALFRRARAMRHQKIPDYRIDGLYLDMLGDSAGQGYAPAMAKLGEYAVRRGTWVEAYYWMSQAKRQGMPNLDPVLRDVRRKWMMDGSPDEVENVYELFPEESASVGRALLNIASGRDVYAAKRFLADKHPEWSR